MARSPCRSDPVDIAPAVKASDIKRPNAHVQVNEEVGNVSG